MGLINVVGDDYSTTSDKALFLRDYLQACVLAFNNLTIQSRQITKSLKKVDKEVKSTIGYKTEFEPGWVISKTWFRSTFAQMLVHGSVDEDPRDVAENTLKLKYAYKKLKWDWEESLDPSKAKKGRVIKLPYLIAHTPENGKVYGEYKALLLSTTQINLYDWVQSKVNGRVWEVIELTRETGLLLSCDYNKHGKLKVLRLPLVQLHLMKKLSVER